jgi:hypothetical protein
MTLKTWSTSRYGTICRNERGIFFFGSTRPFSFRRILINAKLRRRGFFYIYVKALKGGYWLKPGIIYHRQRIRSEEHRAEGLKAGREAYRRARCSNPFDRDNDWLKHIAWDEGWREAIKRMEYLK